MAQYRQCTIKSGVRDLTARITIEDRLWVRIYIFIFIYLFFSVEYSEGVSRGGLYRWSMDRSVRWSSPLDWSADRGSVFSGHPSDTACRKEKDIHGKKIKSLCAFSILVQYNKPSIVIFLYVILPNNGILSGCSDYTIE